MIGPTSNLLQFSLFTSLVCFTDDPDWVELTGNEMISSAVIWQIKNLLLSPSPIWDSHHLAFGKNLSAPPLQIQTHKASFKFFRSYHLLFSINFKDMILCSNFYNLNSKISTTTIKDTFAKHFKNF